ncbi:hypothetical protein [Mycoplana rhizolycopersici]|uniref:Uncharacterized protein n=1 Tax=Mycoplana rhizolycopersici TaxID=2746702 RepID=A0ABX2QE26_9HYPH|nr:hypothetical protein [Rhizobium rhizolycopersici]NVP55985.1 hypothetical protein [Rhizobium rhizolycopersici]
MKEEPLIDQIDEARDLIKTAWLALNATQWVDNDMLLHVAATIDNGLRKLDAARSVVNAAHGRRA